MCRSGDLAAAKRVRLVMAVADAVRLGLLNDIGIPSSNLLGLTSGQLV